MQTQFFILVFWGVLLATLSLQAKWPNDVNNPWKDPETPIVIDAYQGNPIIWDKMDKDERVIGVIHRSTIGMRKDTKYDERKKEALDRGYLWGAYHLGKPGNPIRQAKFFLEVVGNDTDTLLVLDLENVHAKNMMNAKEAKQFVEYVVEKTGQIPVIYANHSTTIAIAKAWKGDELMKKTRLWYARFRKDIPKFPRDFWNDYFLWQFSSEINCKKTGTCLYNAPGTLFDMDINVHYGPMQDFGDNWIQYEESATRAAAKN